MFLLWMGTFLFLTFSSSNYWQQKSSMVCRISADNFKKAITLVSHRHICRFLIYIYTLDWWLAAVGARGACFNRTGGAVGGLNPGFMLTFVWQNDWMSVGRRLFRRLVGFMMSRQVAVLASFSRTLGKKLTSRWCRNCPKDEAVTFVHLEFCAMTSPSGSRMFLKATPGVPWHSETSILHKPLIIFFLYQYIIHTTFPPTQGKSLSLLAFFFSKLAC